MSKTQIMKQNIKLFLTLVFTKNEKTGDVTAFYAQFPGATSQGRTEQEAENLLDEILPYILIEKKDEFLKYHQTPDSNFKITDREILMPA